MHLNGLGYRVPQGALQTCVVLLNKSGNVNLCISLWANVIWLNATHGMTWHRGGRVGYYLAEELDVCSLSPATLIQPLTSCCINCLQRFKNDLKFKKAENEHRFCAIKLTVGHSFINVELQQQL